MAIEVILRRLIQSRTTIAPIILHRSSLQQSARHLTSRAFSGHNHHSSPSPPVPPAPPALDCLWEFRRGFAKRRSAKVESDNEEMVGVIPNIASNAKEAATSQMEAALTALSQQLSKLRTGRASAGMLDHIIVETNGIKIPLNGVAAVSVIDAKTLSVSPYDSSAMKAIETAIVTSPLGLNPRTDGERLIAVIPPLTKEHIQAISKLVAKSSEEVKQSIRRARQKALDTVKKAGSSFPKDEAKRFEKEVDDLTKKYIKSAEDICKAKEKEISQG